MEFKTCEEYVMSEFATTRSNLEEALKKIEELEKQVELLQAEVKLLKERKSLTTKM